MVYSRKYGYYKFPGGGIEENETPLQALIRETREEVGLVVLPESITEFGMVHRIQKSQTNEKQCFIQDNYYYFCEVKKERIPQELNEYEGDEGYSLRYVFPSEAIEANRTVGETPYSKDMFEREAKVLELLLKEGYVTETAYW